jgi:prevent-host-death family protein
MEIAAGEFKAQCLRLMDEVQQTRQEVVITKHGKPVAKLVPVKEASSDSLLGFLKDSVQVTGDIVAPLEDLWEAMQ